MPEPTCPMSREEVVDRYFLEHRAKLIDLAAFLDRLDRAASGDASAPADFRVRAMLRALDILRDGQPQRARRVLELLSDPTIEPIAEASNQGARGAYDGPPRPSAPH